VDPTIVVQPSAGTEEPHDAKPLVRTTTYDQMMVGHIPARRHGFLPRPALLARLSRASHESPVVVLTGTPGAGKTQLAAAYARAKLARGWRLVAWVNARDSESVAVGLAAVADAILASRGGSGPRAADAGQVVQQWLEADGNRCLLVFDDAEDPGVLRPFVPADGAARVVITAAGEAVTELGTSIPIDVFSAEEALALLDGRTGLADEPGAAAVAAELGYLPLALDQAAATITEQHLTYTAYLAMLRALPVEEYQIRENHQPYPQGVAEAALLSLEAFRVSDRVGVYTGAMEVMAVLSPAGVRRDLLRSAGPAGMLASGGRRVPEPIVDQALAQLDERSLVGFSQDGQAVMVHPLVARVVREGLARRGRLAAACQAAAFALETFAEALAVPWGHTLAMDLFGHVTALVRNAGGSAYDTDEKLPMMLMRLRFLVLYHLIELGDSMPQAIAIGEPLTADLERSLGPDHPDTLNTRNILATAYQAAGRSAEAIPLFERDLAGWERLLGPDHPDTMRSRDNLAAAYRQAGRVADAVPIVEYILATREKASGADHPSTLAARNNLATAYLATGRIAEAIPLFERNLAGCERMLGPDHPRTWTTRHNLANARQEAARAGDADTDGEGDGDVVREGDLASLGDHNGDGPDERAGGDTSV
jgi:tetratricopeptide (TPR) repeat protein